MSRIGKIPVDVPKEVKVTISPRQVHMEGPKGKLDLTLPEGISIEQDSGKLVVKRRSDIKQDRANHGTIRSHLVNMVTGVTQGHKKELEISGIGFRANLQGKKIVFNLGLSHPIEFPFPDDVKVGVVNQTEVSIEGADIVVIGQLAAKIRGLKPAEPYKGKGIKYRGEVIRRKQGKSVGK